MHAPIERASFLPRDQAKQDVRRKRNRRHFFLTLAVIGALILARLALRFFFPGAFT